MTFRKRVPVLELEITKTFRLASVPAADAANPDFPAYHLELEVGIKNIGEKTHSVSYRFEGPTGLPIEGAWYASKVSRTWSGAGMRDVLVRFNGMSTEQITPSEIAAAGFDRKFTNSPLDFIAVDGIYFASAVVPLKAEQADLWFSQVRPLAAGTIPEEKSQIRLTDVSFRLNSVVESLAAGEKLPLA